MSRVLFGREVLYSAETEITEKNLIDVLNEVLPVHNKNSEEIDYLYRYYRGQQPILKRKKDVRPEICNKIVENHAYEIVEFKKGYVFGDPIQYVRRGESTEENQIPQLNEYMYLADKAQKDKELAEWFLIGGTAYRMVLPSIYPTVPFEIDTLDPRYTFVVYSNGFGRKPLMGVKYVKTNEGANLYSIYTQTTYFEVLNDKIKKIQPHALKYIPIIEYPSNSSRLGAFEPALPLLNALNGLTSNRLDGIEQFIQSFFKFINCDIDEAKFEAMRALGAIKVRSDSSNPADVDIISQELDQSHTQITKDDIYNAILIICSMPNRNQNAKSTSDTGQAVLLRDGWGAAESSAKDLETIFKSSERRFLEIVLRILQDSSRLNIDLGEVDIKFTRNKTDNMLVKTQGLQNLLEAGIHPKIAIATCNVFSDPEQVYLDSEEYLEKWKYESANVTPANNKPNPVGDFIDTG